MSRATTETVDELHGLVAEVLTEKLKDAKDISPQMLAQAIKFLKENGIDAPATSKRMQDLASALDDLDEDATAYEMASSK